MENHRVALAVLVVAAVTAMLFVNPSITGYVATETQSHGLDITITESQQIEVNWNSEEVHLLSFSLSGVVIGTGIVNIYLSDGETEWLVFTNKQKKMSSLQSITGLAVYDLELKKGVHLDRIESLPDGFYTKEGVFQNVCKETCALDLNFDNKPAFLNVVVEPGTTLSISSVQFSTESK